MFHKQNLSDTSEFEEALNATPDSRARDRNDIMEVPSGTDAGKAVDSSAFKHVAPPINPIEQLGYTSLHDAARDNAYRAVAVLLESGADVNAKNDLVLLESGTDANAEDDKGHTPLHIAAEKKAHEAVKVLCCHRERRGWSW